MELIMDDYSQDGQTLGTDDILALLRAMQTRVQSVFFCCFVLGSDMRALLRSYNGKGRCEEIRVDTKEVEDLKQWAQIIGWDVEVDDDTDDDTEDSCLVTLKRGQLQQS